MAKAQSYIADCKINFFGCGISSKEYHMGFRFDDLNNTRDIMLKELKKYADTIDNLIIKLYQIEAVEINIDIYWAENRDYVYCDNSIFAKYDLHKSEFVLINQSTSAA